MKTDVLSLMKVTPKLLPMHPSEFMSFVSFAIQKDEFVTLFMEDTGTSEQAFIRAFSRSPIEIMTDNACNFDPRKELMASFMDWLAINHWGLEDDTVEEKDYYG